MLIKNNGYGIAAVLSQSRFVNVDISSGTKDLSLLSFQ